MADDDSNSTCHTAIPMANGDVIGLIVTTDGEYFVSSLMRLEEFPDGDEIELAEEDRLVADFEMLSNKHFVLAESTGSIIEVRGRDIQETADLGTILSGIVQLEGKGLCAHGYGGRIFLRAGTDWTSLPPLRSDVTCVRVSKSGTLYATGREGLFARLQGAQWETLDLGTNVDLRAMLVLADGSILICGRSGFAGLWSDESFTKLSVPELDYSDLAYFKGKVFVGAGSDGLAVFEKGSFKILKDNVFSYSLRSNEKYLAIAGNNEIVRYDGKDFPCLEFNYDLEDD